MPKPLDNYYQQSYNVRVLTKYVSALTIYDGSVKIMKEDKISRAEECGKYHEDSNHEDICNHCDDFIKCKSESDDFCECEKADCQHRGTVLYELRSLNNMLHLHRQKHKQARVHFNNYFSDIQMIHIWIMGYIYYHKGAIFQKDLEAEFEVRRSTMTGILQTMEKHGLIVRESVEYDARLKKLVLTDKAEQFVVEHIKAMDDLNNRLLDGISDDEVRVFFRVIAKIKANVNDDLQEMEDS